MWLGVRNGEGPRPRSALGPGLEWLKELLDASRDRPALSLSVFAASRGRLPSFHVSGTLAVV